MTTPMTEPSVPILKDLSFLYIAAGHLTIGDIPAGAMTYRWYGLDIERPDLPALRAWYERLTERQAYADHVMLPIT